MKLWQVILGGGIAAVVAILINLALLACGIWVVVAILQWMGVL